MLPFIFRRLLLIPIVVVAVNFLGFAYAHVAAYLQQLQNPFGTRAEPPAVLPLYADYAQALVRLETGAFPVGVELTIGEAILEAAGKSLGLLAIAAVCSVTLGMALGLTAVRVDPPGVAPWLTPLASLGLAMPSFYLTLLFVGAALAWVLSGAGAFPLPVAGFGWDAHLVLPVLALTLRPAMQIAQVTATLLADEMRRQYVVTARSVGNTWRRIRWRHTLRNALAPAVLNLFGALRLSVAELVLVEWLLSWPGVGRLLALTLVAPNLATPASVSGGGQFFLNPPLLAALLAVFTGVLMLIDLAASSLARAADPRLRLTEGAGGASHG